MRLPIAFLLAAALGAAADSVTLKDRSVIEGKVLSSTDREVVINTYNSTMKEMTWGVKTFDRGQVVKVEITPPDPLRDYWEKSSVARPDRRDLMAFCAANGLTVEQKEEAAWVLASDPANADARSVLGADADRLLRADPRLSSDLRGRLADYAKLDAAARRGVYEGWKKDLGVSLPPQYFDRVVRSLEQPKGLQEDVKLTYNTRKAGGKYSVWVPEDYDPHRAYPLLVGLHGSVNGLGGVGNGKDFIKHFLVEAPKWGCIVVCPTCEPLPWTGHPDEYTLSFVSEVQLLYNVDMNRVYLIGHSRGGMGTWYFGPAYADRWAAFAPAAGSGSGNAMKAHQTGTGMYIYHSSDDPQVGVGDDRSAALTLQKQKADFIYTEYSNAAHGWPREVVDDTLQFFKRHHQMKKGAKGPEAVRGTRPSFAEPLWPDENLYFPVRPAGGAAADDVATLVSDIEMGGTRAEKAAGKLLEKKDKAAISPLSKLALDPKQPEDTRVQAARALGALKDPGAAGTLVRLLQDKSLKLRRAAADSLATAGDRKEGMAIAGALDALGKEFDKDLKKLDIAPWEDYLAADAACVAAMAALGETRVGAVVSQVAVKKILLAADLPKFSTGYDPEVARKKAALAILAALPAFQDARLKADVQAIRGKFANDAEVGLRASDAEGKMP